MDEKGCTIGFERGQKEPRMKRGLNAELQRGCFSVFDFCFIRGSFVYFRI